MVHGVRQSKLMSRLVAIAGTFALFASGSSAADAQVHGSDTETMLPEVPVAEPPPPVFSVNLTGASDYIFRGVSQTENHAAIFGSAKVAYDHFYLAAGGENVDFHNGINTEYDLSGGWTPSLAKFDFDLGFIRYGYIGAPAGVSIDTVELHAAVARTIGPVKLGASFHHALEYFGTKRPANYFEGNTTYTIVHGLTLRGAIGRQEIDAGHSFTTWNLGPAYALNKHIAVGFRYSDTDAHADGRLYGPHYVGSVRVGF